MSDDGVSLDGDDGVLIGRDRATVAGKTYLEHVSGYGELRDGKGSTVPFRIGETLPYPPPPADPVNHPPHYTSHPSGVECITITRHMGFNLGNALKHIWRADLKGSSIQDLEKAAWYIQDELDQRRQKAFPGAGPHDGT